MRDRKPKRLDEDGLREMALRLLGGRAHSTSELREKLRRRAERAGDIDTVLAGLKERGFLNDKQFAEMYAQARLNNEGHGSRRVLRDLRQRRVAPAVAEKAVTQTFEGKDEIELIEKYLERKYRNTNLGDLLADPKRLSSVYRRLRYAGFSPGASIGVLKRYAEQAEALEGMESGSEEEE